MGARRCLVIHRNFFLLINSVGIWGARFPHNNYIDTGLIKVKLESGVSGEKEGRNGGEACNIHTPCHILYRQRPTASQTQQPKSGVCGTHRWVAAWLNGETVFTPGFIRGWRVRCVRVRLWWCDWWDVELGVGNGLGVYAIYAPRYVCTEFLGLINMGIGIWGSWKCFFA